MSDRRGFTYALETLRTLCELDLGRLRGDLAQANSRVRTQEEAVSRLDAQFGQECARRVDAGAVVSIEVRRMQHAHVRRIAETLLQAQARLRSVEQERDGFMQASVRLARFRDGVEDHRKGKLAEFDRIAAARELREADDHWLIGRDRSAR
jgi:hypothetical protein